jgi:hypothetical protein
MKKVEKATGGLQKRIRDRMRSVNQKVMAIALAGRLKGPEGQERRVQRYRELVSLTRKMCSKRREYGKKCGSFQAVGKGG